MRFPLGRTPSGAAPGVYRMAESARSYKWIVLIIASIGSMMAPLDGSIVNVSLPTIAESLDMDYAQIIWVPTAYLVTLTVLLLIVGRLSDMRGRKPFFVFGFAVFTLGSFLCSASQSGSELIAFRVLQAVGGACFAATSTAIVTDVFPSKERGKALGITIMSVYIGSALGPTLGGFLTYTLGWRSIFWVNIPIGILVIALAVMKLKPSGPTRTDERFDLLGSLTFGTGLITLLVAMTLGESIGWTSATIVSMFAVALLSFGLFIFVETKRGHAAMFDLSLIRHNRLFAAANLAALLNYTAFFGVSFVMSFYLQRVLGLTSLQTGAVLLATPVTMAILAPIAGWASDRVGSRLLSTGGMVIIAAVLLLMSMLNEASSIALVTVYLLLLGVGMGLFSSPNTSAVMGCVTKKDLGVASGMLSTMRTTGQSVSLTVVGAVMATVASSSIMSSIFSGGAGPDIGVEAAAFVQGMSAAFLVCATIAAVGAVFSFARGPPNACEMPEGAGRAP